MASRSDLTGLNVLVVEDEAMVLMLIEDMLADLGCAVAATATGVDEALACVAAGGFDCALLDMNLAGRPAHPVADALRASGAPFAYATGYGEPRLREVDRDVPVLQKPFREGELAAVLRRLR
jgi:CheY-like chemotaxis protein